MTKVIGLIVAVVTFINLAEAQQHPKMAVVGELLFRDRPNLGLGRQILRQQLRDLDISKAKI